MLNKILLMSFLSFFTPDTQSVDPFSTNTPFDYELIAGDDSKFTQDEKNILDEAMVVLSKTFFSRSVRMCYRENYVYALSSAKYRKRMGIPDTDAHKLEMLDHQMYYLLDAYSNSEFEFPQITIQADYEENGPYASAPVGTLLTKWQSREGSGVSGYFKVFINRWRLGTNSKVGYDPDFWAATIAHELLHNLGHEHWDTSHKEYNDAQLLAFDYCLLQSRRRSAKGEVGEEKKRTPRMTCGQSRSDSR